MENHNGFKRTIYITESMREEDWDNYKIRPLQQKGRKLPKKLNLYLYAKYASNIIIYPELILIQKIFFWQFPPFLLQRPHLNEG